MVKILGDLCHRSGYIQNAAVKNLLFSGPQSKKLRLSPGAYSLTVFVGADFGRMTVDYTVELIADRSTHIHFPGRSPIRATTVGATGFVIIDFNLS
ncbi:MAG TPA: hypothetical protein VLQ89_08425 [Candidatus Binatia bacterium]|nr:hypothetical protein [Candidatus Binatia bacterium]